MFDAVLLAGDRYHKAEDAFTGVGPVLETAGLDVAYATDFSSINESGLCGRAVTLKRTFIRRQTACLCVSARGHATAAWAQKPEPERGFVRCASAKRVEN